MRINKIRGLLFDTRGEWLRKKFGYIEISGETRRLIKGERKLEVDQLY